MSAFDSFWALLTPWLALWLRDARVLSFDWPTAALFCGIAFISSLIGFLIFRIREGMTHLFSVHDALDVAKAVLFSEFVTCLVLFSFTRLEGIPRSTPLIHALLLSAGLVCARAFLRITYSEPDPARTSQGNGSVEHVIVIGSNRLSALYISLLRAYARDRFRVIALFDDRPEMTGRAIAGNRVLGPPSHLLPVIEEFREHGIRTDRVLVGGDPDLLTQEAMAEIRRICADQQIPLNFIPHLIGLDALQAATPENEVPPVRRERITIALPRYLMVKRYIDFGLSLMAIIVLLPLFAIIAAVVLLDVGSPVFFWQRRMGMDGQSFQLHKFRTLKPSYDGQGRPVATDRVSWLGELLRRLRLDELPQLLNVLVGDMSLIGPRPLLPHDQPSDPTVRLMVRPGITGWAQVNGGKLLTPEEKNALDEWYVRNASLWLDLKIAVLTGVFMLGGEHGLARSNGNSTAAIDIESRSNRPA